jgi:hypothetical protein
MLAAKHKFFIMLSLHNRVLLFWYISEVEMYLYILSQPLEVKYTE